MTGAQGVCGRECRFRKGCGRKSVQGPDPGGLCHAKELGFKSYMERESKDEVRGICAGGE